MNLSLKQKIMVAVGIIGAILILIFQRGIYSNPEASAPNPEPVKQTAQIDKPEVVSTNPSPLDQSIIWAMQPIIITFNLPLENAPEFKHSFEPNFEHNTELSEDKKTVTLTPLKPLDLGVVYTLKVKPDTKFAGSKTLGKDLIYNIRTIEYKGV
jgi:hypothetical protein